MLRRALPVCCATLLLTAAVAFAAEPVAIAGGALRFAPPAGWKAVPPQSPILEHEFAVAAPEGSADAPARLTLMAAGGSVDQNVARWIGQFQGTEGGADRSRAKIEKVTPASGMSTTLVDISGVYLESAGGPFGPKTPREGYRLLGAIVETGGQGTYFFKLIGPEATVAAAAEAFKESINTVEKP